MRRNATDSEIRRNKEEKELRNMDTSRARKNNTIKDYSESLIHIG